MARLSVLAQIARWVLVLPGAIVAAVLIGFPLHWTILATFRYGEMVEVSPEVAANIERAVYPFFAAVAFVHVGARIAPRYRLVTSIILAVFYGILLCLALRLAAKSELVVMYPFRALGGAAGAGAGILLTWFVFRGRPLKQA